MPCIYSREPFYILNPSQYLTLASIRQDEDEEGDDESNYKSRRFEHFGLPRRPRRRIHRHGHHHHKHGKHNKKDAGEGAVSGDEEGDYDTHVDESGDDATAKSGKAHLDLDNFENAVEHGTEEIFKHALHMDHGHKDEFDECESVSESVSQSVGPPPRFQEPN